MKNIISKLHSSYSGVQIGQDGWKKMTNVIFYTLFLKIQSLT